VGNQKQVTPENLQVYIRNAWDGNYTDFKNFMDNPNRVIELAQRSDFKNAAKKLKNYSEVHANVLRIMNTQYVKEQHRVTREELSNLFHTQENINKLSGSQFDDSIADLIELGLIREFLIDEVESYEFRVLLPYLILPDVEEVPSGLG